MVENDAPMIRRLTIKRFRGHADFDWLPRPGLNVLVGGGDVGKTTVLDAISLLLTPSSSPRLGASDYFLQEVDQGFAIEAVFHLPDRVGINTLGKQVYPWQWDGEQARIPDIEGEQSPSEEEAVYVLRVRGTSDFEVFHEIVQPHGDPTYMPVGLRRRIGLVALAEDDDVDRDLRLIYGSALDRLLADAALRSRLGFHLGGADFEAKLKPDRRERLAELDEAFRIRSLPSDLGLGLTGARRISLNALVGLTAERMGERLGLASWGTGTRRLAALQVAAANQTDAPLTVVDELERGLEPHRQRVLVRDMMERDSQAFVTTHSPVALSAASGASLWHVGIDGSVGELTDRALKHAARDPETFLCRLPIVVEGATEVGFVKGLLDRTIAGALLDLGVWVTDGGGHEATLSLLQVLSSAGVSAGGFADDEEGKYQGRWESVRDYLGDLLFRWPTGATEANVLAVIEEDDLQRFVEDPDDELTGERLRTMAERIGSTEDKSWSSLQSNCDDLKGLVLASALGEVPDPIPDDGEAKRYRKHSRHWFKTERGGRELFDKLFTLGNFTGLEPELLRFVNAVRNSLGMEPLDRLR